MNTAQILTRIATEVIEIGRVKYQENGECIFCGAWHKKYGVRIEELNHKKDCVGLLAKLLEEK